METTAESKTLQFELEAPISTCRTAFQAEVGVKVIRVGPITDSLGGREKSPSFHLGLSVLKK